MKARALLLLPALGLLAACNPSSGEIESALLSRGLGKQEAGCVARELGGKLQERDWLLIAEVAGDTMRTPEEWKDMTIGEVGDKLMRLGDARLISTLMRAGLGCSLLGNERLAGATL